MEVVSRECKFVLYFPKLEVEDDIHMVKEVITYDNGNVEKKLRILPNYKIPFYITKPHLQRYKQKHESESLDNLNKFSSSKKMLATEIASRLGLVAPGKKTMRDVNSSPYLYGTDVDSRAIIKEAYLKMWPVTPTPYNVAALDIETNIETEEIIIISIACNIEVYIGIVKQLVEKEPDVINRLKLMYDKYIPKTDLNSKITPIFKILENEAELIKDVITHLHTWDIDFCAIWNINYDIPKILERCEKLQIEPKEIFSDPNVPINLRYFEYKEGNSQKMTESGKFKPLNFEERWHIVLTPCKFYWIDAACAYYFIRVGSKAIHGGYSLNNVLEKELGKNMKKLKFEEEVSADLQGVDWHKYMVKNKPLEYTIYNVWDVLSMLELDNKTKDLTTSISGLCGISSFDIFNSGPKKIVDAMHFYYLEQGRVLGVKSPVPDDDNLLGLADWINILNSSYIMDNRKDNINEDVSNNINLQVFDLDAVSSYPSNTTAANVSKDTTCRELLKVIDRDFNDIRRENINLFFGGVNSVSYCTNVLKFPPLKDLPSL